MLNRIAELLQLQSQDPSDPFFIYALALEFEKENNLEKCFANFVKFLNFQLPFSRPIGSRPSEAETKERTQECVRRWAHVRFRRVQSAGRC